MAICRSVEECDKQALRILTLIRLTELDPDLSQFRRDARCKVYRRELDRVLELRHKMIQTGEAG